ncbi:GNAT family N-acetyltransferase [Mobilitalea sibirica]|nr:GNAT family N-acetyltransferase [Mobilitalea sibirica]
MVLEECDKIKEINPEHYIGKAWRLVNGMRQLVLIDYLEKDWPNGYEEHYDSLRKTLRTNGTAFGAFDTNNRLLGFATIDLNLFGERYKYALLDQMFISKECRSMGIGKKLFWLCADEARQQKADKIYICAGSAEDTIAFYFAIGCLEAAEINKTLYESDPRDYQLEYTL